MNQAYFDCNATTPTLPCAADAALEVMRSLYGNPSSSHLAGLQARYILEGARRTAARAIGASPEEIIFTSGATEAIQTAIFSVLQELRSRLRSRILNSNSPIRLLHGATEHKAVPEALHHWVGSLGLPFEVVSVPVDSHGQLDLQALESEATGAALVCTMSVNNETGVIQDLRGIEECLNRCAPEAYWLVDSVQALGKLDMQLSKTRIHYAPFSGHKLYAPKGVGFLYVRKGAPLFPLMVGGGQEHGLRSGTENLPGVAALGKILEALTPAGDPGRDRLFLPHSKLVEFRERIASELKRCFPRVEFNTPFEHSVPTTINFSVQGLGSKELMDLFDSGGLRVSAGSACSSASLKPSHVLEAMGLPEWRTVSALRLSFGPATTEVEIEAGCRAIREAALALQGSCLLETRGDFEPPISLRDGIVQFRAGGANSWIINHRESRSAVVIDPCESVAERIEHYLRCQDLKILSILDSHSHADHDSVRPVLSKILEDRFQEPKTEVDDLGWPTSSFEVELEDGSLAPALILGTSVEGTHVLARIPTPGHTGDSHTLLQGVITAGSRKLLRGGIRFVFCGDMVLSGGLGRTNFASSDAEALFRSLRFLDRIIGPSALLCPAHDYNNSFGTLLGAEVENNPILAQALSPLGNAALPAFVQAKTRIDQDLARLEESFRGTVCGVTPSTTSPIPSAGDCRRDAPISLSWEALRELLATRGSTVTVLDVRESQEFSVYKDWAELGLASAPRNVPLSRFVNFMSEMVHGAGQEPREVVLVCRSGTRSLQAARSLRRLGFDRVWNLEGGVALGRGFSHSSTDTL